MLPSKSTRLPRTRATYSIRGTAARGQRVWWHTQCIYPFFTFSSIRCEPRYSKKIMHGMAIFFCNGIVWLWNHRSALNNKSTDIISNMVTTVKSAASAGFKTIPSFPTIEMKYASAKIRCRLLASFDNNRGPQTQKKIWLLPAHLTTTAA